MSDGLYTVIAVDDEIWALRGLCSIVDWDAYGFTIVGSYTDSSEALDNIVEKCPDVIFTDIRMPDIDGMELIESIHSEGVTSRLVIVSAYRDFDVARRAIAKDVTDYLMKPLDKKEVADLLSRLKLTLDKERSELQFDIKHYDLSQKNSLNNVEVMRFLEQAGGAGCCRLVACNHSLMDEEELSEFLTEIYVKGFKHSYLCKNIADVSVFETVLAKHPDMLIGVSRAFTSFGEFDKMLEDVREAYSGSFLYSDNPKISAIQDFLSRNYSKKLSLPEIAEHFYVSESYLYELFRKNTDTSVVGFIKNVRLSKACGLLSEGGHIISEVADIVGYPDVGYFGKLFKAKYGCTPEQYATANTTSQK